MVRMILGKQVQSKKMEASAVLMAPDYSSDIIVLVFIILLLAADNSFFPLPLGMLKQFKRFLKPLLFCACCRI